MQLLGWQRVLTLRNSLECGLLVFSAVDGKLGKGMGQGEQRVLKIFETFGIKDRLLEFEM